MITHVYGAGAAPGCLLRGAKCLATAARGQKFCASSEKVAQRRGGGGGEFPDTFFFSDFKKFQQKIHNGVGVVSSWP